MNRLGLGHEFFLDQERIAVHIESLVVFFWLIQSQCQTRPRSAARREVHANRRPLFVAEVGIELRFGSW